jgi:hypothetical protein
MNHKLQSSYTPVDIYLIHFILHPFHFHDAVLSLFDIGLDFQFPLLACSSTKGRPFITPPCFGLVALVSCVRFVLENRKWLLVQVTPLRCISLDQDGNSGTILTVLAILGKLSIPISSSHKSRWSISSGLCWHSYNSCKRLRANFMIADPSFMLS